METKIIGKKRIFLPETDSTNSYAMELLKNVKPEEGTLIYTDFQKLGRGQRGMVWKADTACNLTFSVILKPHFLSAENFYFLYKIAALSCYDTLTNFIDSSQFDIKIKWPNDILVNKRKIGGILIENTFSDQLLQWSVLGIGININQTMAGSELNAVSLFDLIKKETNRMAVLDQFCQIFDAYYLQLKNGDRTIIDQAYLSRLLGINEWCPVIYRNELKSVQVKGINYNGLLILGDKTGNQFTVDIKEVNWLLQS